MANKIEIIPGTKYKKLTVIEELPARIRTDGRLRRVLLCKCDCGKEKEILFQSFSVGRVASCGCHQKIVVAKGKFSMKHGLSSHPAFTTWRCMINRCYDATHKGYKYYGGRGIIVCSQWKNNPGVFIKWLLANGWKKGLQIDRRNNDGNYEPSNCHVVTPYENLMNRRCTKR